MTDTSPLTTGSPAPTVSLPVTGGGSLTISDLQPVRVVLFFYPRDDTSGCTAEAIEFSHRLADFEAAGARVYGISKDSIAKHDKFRAKHDLTVDLLSDADSDVCERYGVWVEKKMYGKTHMGIERSTFIIGPDGTVEHIWRKVKVPGHVNEVLEAVQGA